MKRILSAIDNKLNRTNPNEFTKYEEEKKRDRIQAIKTFKTQKNTKKSDDFSDKIKSTSRPVTSRKVNFFFLFPSQL